MRYFFFDQKTSEMIFSVMTNKLSNTYMQSSSWKKNWTNNWKKNDNLIEQYCNAIKNNAFLLWNYTSYWLMLTVS